MENTTKISFNGMNTTKIEKNMDNIDIFMQFFINLCYN